MQVNYRTLLPLVLLAQLLVGSSGVTADQVFRPPPSFRTATPGMLAASVVEQERLTEEARYRNLQYSLIALIGAVALFFGLGPFIRQVRKIPKTSEDIAIGSIAGAVKAKRRLAKKVEDKINSSSTEE